jgi:hypothetical protein
MLAREDCRRKQRGRFAQRGDIDSGDTEDLRLNQESGRDRHDASKHGTGRPPHAAWRVKNLAMTVPVCAADARFTTPEHSRVVPVERCRQSPRLL